MTKNWLIQKNNDNEYKKYPNVTFLPITKVGKEICSIEDISPSPDERNEFFQHSLPKGKYNIHYTINLLRILLDQIEKIKMNPRDIAFTLSSSIKRLLAMLEVESEQMKN